MKYQIGDRYRIIEPKIDAYMKMFSIVYIEDDYVYYSFDGERIIHCFRMNTIFEDFIQKI